MALPMVQSKQRWYNEGLRFKCTGCGGCCTGAPGYVWVDDVEIKTMADHLNIPVDLFSRKYLRSVNGKKSLLEHSVSYDCVFLKDKKCSIYNARPTQCRTFPWWARNLESKEDWDEAASYCEGINHPDAPIIDLDTIEQQRQLDEKD